MSRRYDKRWTNHLEDERDIKAFEEQCRLSLPTLLKLAELIDGEITRETNKSEEVKNYELPCWSEFQADAIGYRRGLRYVKSLIKLLDK
jgi:hypothetical protein